MDPNHLEVNAGGVVFEIDLFLSSDSGRSKHTDLIEQGGWLLDPITRAIRALGQAEGVAFDSVRYMGVGPSGLEEVLRLEVGAPIEPIPPDEAALVQASLVGIIREMARLTAGCLDKLEDPSGLLAAMHPNTGQDVLNVVSRTMARGQLPEPSFEPWSDAFDVLRHALE